MPTVSVIMPTYNTDPVFMDEAVSGVINQTFEDWELLIIDNASSNQATLDYLKSLKDPRIKIFYNDTNLNIVGGRNFLIERAHGKYIAPLDHDDVWTPEKLTKQVAMMEADPDLGCVATMVRFIDGHSQRIQDAASWDQQWYSDDSQMIELQLLLSLNPIVNSSAMIRKSVLDKYNLRYEHTFQTADDFRLWTMLVSKCKFAFVREELTFYRWHQNNESLAKSEFQASCACRAKQQACLTLFGEDLYDNALWETFFHGSPKNSAEVAKLLTLLEHSLAVFEKHGYAQETLVSFFKHQYRGLFYRSKWLGAQWKLLTSPLNGFFKLSLGWRIFCFITRGIL